jgi:hypothetical protein
METEWYAFFKIKKGYISEFTFRFSSWTNFCYGNIKANTLFMTAKTELFRSNKIMCIKAYFEIL